jgi:hypothetical protein
VQYDLDVRDVDGSRRGVCFLEEQEAASPIADPDPAPRADVDEAMVSFCFIIYNDLTSLHPVHPFSLCQPATDPSPADPGFEPAFIA